jgi:sec-independent protein translocase protein TatA
MGELRPWHIAVLAVVVILLFGSKRLPDAARALGRSMRILKAETKDLVGESANRDGGSDASGEGTGGEARAQTAPRPVQSGPVQSGPVQSSPVQGTVVDPVERVRDN